MDVAGKQRRLTWASRARDDAPFEKFQNFHAGGMCHRGGLVTRRVGPYEMIDGRARRRLAAFVEPESRNHPGIVGTPNARDKARLGRCRHDAGRGAHDVSKATAHIDRLARLLAPSDRAHASGVSVDQRRADRRSLKQTEIVRRGLCQADAQRRAGCNDLFSDLRVALGCEISKTYAIEIAAAPAEFVGQEIPFASERAY